MQNYIEQCKGDGKALDWAELALDASMELEAGIDDEFTALMNSLLGVGYSMEAKGTEAQEEVFRKAVVVAVTKASTETRRLAIAQALEATVGVVDDQKKVSASFLSNRVSGPGGSVVLGKEGSLRKEEVDGRAVLRLNMFATEQTKQDSVQDFAVRALGIPVHITRRQFDAGHCYLRCPQTQVSKILARETSRKYI